MEGDLFWHFSQHLHARPLYLVLTTLVKHHLCSLWLRGLNALFGALKTESTLPPARWCLPWLSLVFHAFPAEVKPLGRRGDVELPGGAHSSGSLGSLWLEEARDESEL